MIAVPRLTWLFRVVMAAVAMLCALRVGASPDDQPLSATAPAARATSARAIRADGAAQSVAGNLGRPMDRASVRLASTTRAAWQRSTGRRGHRSASSHVSGAERAMGPCCRLVRDPHRRLPVRARREELRRQGQFDAAPPRAPPLSR